MAHEHGLALLEAAIERSRLDEGHQHPAERNLPIARNVRSVEDRLAKNQLNDATRQLQDDVLKDIEALIRRVRQGLRIVGIATSERSAAQARDGGIPLTRVADVATARHGIITGLAFALTNGYVVEVEAMRGARLRRFAAAALSLSRSGLRFG